MIAPLHKSETKADPRRYFESIAEARTSVAIADPVCLYLETTNRCNLLCTTCPRTFEELEPPSDMSWDLFTSIVDQFPRIERVVLHGIGEPMMVAELPAMVAYLKARGAYVLFNTNGTLMRDKKSRELIGAGLDEMRISLDAAEAKAFELVRGRDLFDRIVRNVKNFVALKKEMGADKPRLSLWLTGLRETLEHCRHSSGWRMRSACRRCICSGWSISAATISALPVRKARCSSAATPRRAITCWKRSASPPNSACSSTPRAPPSRKPASSG